MARKLDPKNLSAGDVARILSPTVLAFAGLLLAFHISQKLGALVLLLIIIGIFVMVIRIPKKDLGRISRRMEESDQKIYRIPVLGPLWRIGGWFHMFFGLIMLLFLFYWIGKQLV